MAIDVIRHIEHAIDVCGEDHVGIGTDGGIASTERTPEFEKQNLESHQGHGRRTAFSARTESPTGFTLSFPISMRPIVSRFSRR